MSGIGVVLNPKSGHNLRILDAPFVLSRRLAITASFARPVRIEELYRIAEDFRRVDNDVLAISGGDGYGHVTLTSS